MPPVLQELLLFTVVGLTIALGLLAIPKPMLDRLARVPGLSPNWLSLWGVPLTLGGVYLIIVGVSLPGFVCAMFGLMLDRIDGKMATGNAPFAPPPGVTGWPLKWAELNHPGPTEMGKWLDALADKIKLLPPLIWIASQGDIPWLPVAIVTVVEIVSSTMRDPFKLFPDSRLRGSAATGLGKLKMVAESVALLMVMPYYLEWFHGELIATTVLLWAAAVLGVLSILSRIDFGSPRANAFVDRFTFTDPFRHDA